MLNISTTRLTIHETNSNTVKSISERNHANGGPDLFSRLSDDDMRVLFENQEALSLLMAKLQSYAGNGEHLYYGIWLASKLIGYLGLKNYTDPLPEVQIEFAPEYQNQGYGYEALSKMIDHFFAAGYQCLRYVVQPFNKASISLVKKLAVNCNHRIVKLKEYCSEPISSTAINAG